MNELHFRTVTSSKLNLESLIELAVSDLYSDQTVLDQLNLNDFAYFPGEDSYPKITTDEYLKIRMSITNIKSEAIQTATNRGQVNEMAARAHFDQLLYRDVREIFPMTEYEAAQVGVWDYVTVRLLLDVALWRFNTEVVRDRFIGLNRARHVYARWWFRRGIADASESAPEYSLLETEWETVFERPSLCWDPDVANACLRVIQDTKGRAPSGFKNRYPGPPNKIWIRRIMRLTSQSTLDAFSEDALYEKFIELHPFNENYS